MITIGAGKWCFLPHTGDVELVQQVIELYEAGVEGGGHLRRAAAARPAGPQLARHVLRPEDGGMLHVRPGLKYFDFTWRRVPAPAQDRS